MEVHEIVRGADGRLTGIRRPVADPRGPFSVVLSLDKDLGELVDAVRSAAGAPPSYNAAAFQAGAAAATRELAELAFEAYEAGIRATALRAFEAGRAFERANPNAASPALTITSQASGA
jgi:hypothetical protein